MWGCTYGLAVSQLSFGVFPTHVGVYRQCSLEIASVSRFPHACGGVPNYFDAVKSDLAFSPRMWGCTAVFAFILAKLLVFPTHVGVYPPMKKGAITNNSFPHACGGVPVLDFAALIPEALLSAG